jgi:hypothetical protein
MTKTKVCSPRLTTRGGGGPMITKISNMEASYASRLLSNLNSLRRMANNLCDVEIVAGLDQTIGQVHYAHRSVLAAASPYFNAMFTSDVLEAKRHRIVIQSLDGTTLDSLLDFIYTGQIRVVNDNVQDLLIAGDMIELQEVVEICTDHLVRQLEPSNAVGIFRFAADHNCLLLKEAALRYVSTNFVQVRFIQLTKREREASPRSESAKQVREASPRSESAKRVREASPRSESAKRVREASLRSESAKRVREASPRSESAKRVHEASPRSKFTKFANQKREA